jgi:replicative DNA helicase
MDMLIDRANRVLRGKIRVVKPGHTLDDIKRAHDNLIAEGFVTGLLIVDYLDLMHPAKKRSDTRYELADMTRDLKAFGEDAGFPVWSGTQVGRQAFTKEVITTKDIAESIEKANASDVIIALCQTEDEEQLGRGRLFMAKVRDAKDLDTFPVKVDKEKQLVAVLND